MQEINTEYDTLFAIWKNRHEAQTGETVKETAVIVRQYLKEKYPTYKSMQFKIVSMITL